MSDKPTSDDVKDAMWRVRRACKHPEENRLYKVFSPGDDKPHRVGFECTLCGFSTERTLNTEAWSHKLMRQVWWLNIHDY